MSVTSRFVFSNKPELAVRPPLLHSSTTRVHPRLPWCALFNPMYQRHRRRTFNVIGAGNAPVPLMHSSILYPCPSVATTVAGVSLLKFVVRTTIEEECPTTVSGASRPMSCRRRRAAFRVHCCIIDPSTSTPEVDCNSQLK